MFLKIKSPTRIIWCQKVRFKGRKIVNDVILRVLDRRNKHTKFTPCICIGWMLLTRLNFTNIPTDIKQYAAGHANKRGRVGKGGCEGEGG